MRLSLSSAAARDASSRELLGGCVSRGLVGLELYESRAATGSDELSAQDLLELNDAARQVGMEVCGLYRHTLSAEDVGATARLAAALSAPAVVPIGGFHRSILPLTAEIFKESGARLLLAHGGDARVVEAIRWLIEPIPHNDVIGLAWEIRPGTDDPIRMPDVLEAAGDALGYVRLYGGGPEAHAQAGLGIGSVMARLTLARFSGPLVLTPSDPRYHQAWNAWLGRARGWGVRRQAIRFIYRGAGHRPARTGATMILANPKLLDVRPVEPKHRFDTIMGAYEEMPVGETMLLTVDHDPTCMYYTLKALQGPETFNFRYLESGPEVWRVAVTRLGQ